MEIVKEGARELWFSDEFFPRVTERLQIMLNCIKNKTEIQDTDYDILRELHKWWFEGKFGWTKPISPEADKKATQIGLFAEELSDKNNGTDIVTIPSEPK